MATTDLIRASAMGQMDVVRTLLASRYKMVNGADAWFRTALMHASMKGHDAIVKGLLLHGADVNCTDKDRWTALMFAASFGCVSTIEMLLSHGAALDHSDIDGLTPLMIAARNGHVAALKSLLARGADATRTDAAGKTALMHAAAKGHVEARDVLLEHDADVLGECNRDQNKDMANAVEMMELRKRLAATESKLAATESKLFVTQSKLAATESKLAAAETRAAATTDSNADDDIATLVACLEQQCTGAVLQTSLESELAELSDPLRLAVRILADSSARAAIAARAGLRKKALLAVHPDKVSRRGRLTREVCSRAAAVIT